MTSLLWIRGLRGLVGLIFLLFVPASWAQQNDGGFVIPNSDVLHLDSQRLNRPLTWDPENEVFIGDAEANTYLKREQRKGYEVA